MAEEQRSFFQDEPAIADTQAIVTPLLVPSKIVLSEPIKVDIGVYRGDSGSFQITVKDNVGAPIDVSSATWDADIRINAAAPVVITNFEIVPVGGDTSSVMVILPSENSELINLPCVYDIEMRLGGTVSTLVYGAITVTQDVSRP
jgi:hypothetical protein